MITSFLAFVSTNIDDIFILTLFFGSKKYSFRAIVAGQFAGVYVLVLASLALAIVGKLADPRYVGLLGIFPIYLGIRQVWELIRKRGRGDDPTLVQTSGNTGFISVATVTIANGGDNIGVYVPLLATYTAMEVGGLVIIFAVMIVAWCYGARYLSRHPWLSERLDKYAHIVMPVVLIALGLFILAESKAFTLLA